MVVNNDVFLKRVKKITFLKSFVEFRREVSLKSVFLSKDMNGQRTKIDHNRSEWVHPAQMS